MRKTRAWCRKCREGGKREEESGQPDLLVERLHKDPMGVVTAHVRCGMCGHAWWASSGFEVLRGYKEARARIEEA